MDSLNTIIESLRAICVWASVYHMIGGGAGRNFMIVLIILNLRSPVCSLMWSRDRSEGDFSQS